MDMQSRISENIRRLRLRAGLSQGQLAVRLGCASQSVSDVERGRCSLSPARADRFAEALGVDVSELVAPVAGD